MTVKQDAAPRQTTAPVSVVVRAYNEEAHIDKLLRGIKAQRLQPTEVILVDSGSADQTVAIAESHGARIVRIAKEDFTFGRALNVGCEAARGELLVFVSAHVYPVYNTWLEKLVEPFNDARVVLSYGRQQGDVVNKFSEHRLFERWFPRERALPQKGYFCNNANCAVRRSVWEQLRYDESLTGLEDLDWAKRAQAAGGWVAYQPEAAIVHVHEESWPQVRNRYRREALALRRIDEHAHFSMIDFLRLLFRNVVADSRAAAHLGLLRREFASIVKFRFNQFLGTWQGHHGPPELSRELKQRFYYPAQSAPLSHDETAHTAHRIDYAQCGGKADKSI